MFLKMKGKKLILTARSSNSSFNLSVGSLGLLLTDDLDSSSILISTSLETSVAPMNPLQFSDSQ